MQYVDFRLTSVPKDRVLEMLKEEQKMRYSDEIQNMYNQGFNKKGDPEYIEKYVQRNLLNNFGYKYDESSIKNYQSIGSYYQEHKDVIDAVHYLRINIIRDCPIGDDELCPDAKIMDLNKKQHKLSQLFNQEKPLVILAGSIT